MTSPRTAFYTTEKLSEKRSRTPEGFLVIHDVPIARTGQMEYHTTEVNIAGDSNGIVVISREPDDVFSAAHITSYNGKPIVDEHPEEDVNPANWREYAMGTVMNPRRGTGAQADLLIADFIVTDEQAIAAIDAGKVEVSCGYDADYEETRPGFGKQKNLYGNHVALVESGRCGPRCAVGDRRTIFRPTSTETGEDMRLRTLDKKPGGWHDRFLKAKDRYLAAIKAKDAEEEKKAEKEMEDAAAEGNAEELAAGEDHTHLHLHRDDINGGGGINSGEPARMTDEEVRGGFSSINDTLGKMAATMDAIAEHVGYKPGDAAATEEIEGQLEEEAPAGTGDKARKARDSVLLIDSFQSVAALAEIMVPGISVFTFDEKLDPKKTLDSICKLRRSALDLAYNTADGRAIIEEVHRKPLTLDSMKCGDVRTLFNAVGAMKKDRNRNIVTRTNDGSRPAAVRDRPKGQWTLGDIQKANDEYWAKRRGDKAAAA